MKVQQQPLEVLLVPLRRSLGASFPLQLFSRWSHVCFQRLLESLESLFHLAVRCSHWPQLISPTHQRMDVLCQTAGEVSPGEASAD